METAGIGHIPLPFREGAGVGASASEPNKSAAFGGYPPPPPP